MFTLEVQYGQYIQIYTLSSQIINYTNITLTDTNTTFLESNLQWATEVVQTFLENDTFRCLIPFSILFASSVNSLIPRPPN